MREARLRKQKATESKLYAVFMSRCEAWLKRAIPDGSRTDVAGLRDEVMFKFNVMFARVGTNEDSTALDYYEVNFNQAFRYLWWKQVRKDNARREVFVEIGQENDEDGRPIDPENTLAKVSEAARTPAKQEHYLYLTQIGEFLSTLYPEDRETVRLVLIEGYTIESDNPAEKTAAKILGVGRRAINKRLAKVAAKLKNFQQET